MKVSLKSVSVTLLCVFVSSPAYADDLKKLKRKYDFVSHKLSCGKVVVGDKAFLPLGADGARRGLSNAQIIDVKTKDKQPLGYDVSLYDQQYGGDGDLFRIFSPENKVGLMDACKGVVTPPKFDAITRYSDDGYAVAITKINYTVLDRNGSEVLNTRLAHGLDVNKFDPVRREGEVYKFSTYNNKIPGSRDGKKWGLFDIKSQQFIAQPVYDGFQFFGDGSSSKPKYIVTKSGKESSLNVETGALAAPFKFEKFDRLEKLNGTTYVIGNNRTTNANGQSVLSANAYNTSTNAYILPQGKVYTVLAPELGGLRSTYTGRWVVGGSVPNATAGHTSPSVGIFDENRRRFLIDILDEPTHNLDRIDDSEYYVAERSTGNAIFDATTGTRITDYHKNINKVDRLQLTTNGRVIPLLIVSHESSKLFWAYDGNKNLVHSGQGVGADWAKTANDIFILTERESRRSTAKGYTCLDENYAILGSPKTCNVNAPHSVSAQPIVSRQSTVASGPKLAERPCDHTMFKRKPNVANDARVEVSSTYCKSGDCYDKKNMIDNERNDALGARYSWTNDGSGEKWALFSWGRPIKDMEQIYFVGTKGYEPRSYKITVETSQGWRTVASVGYNTENKICHRFPKEDITAVKIEGTGPKKQPAYFRLNEVVIR